MDDFDFDALEAELHEEPSMGLAERATYEYDHYQGELELALQRAAADLLDEVLGVSLTEAKNVRTNVSDLNGGGIIYVTVDGIDLKVTLSETSDPMLHAHYLPTHGTGHWTPIESLADLGLKLKLNKVTRVPLIEPCRTGAQPGVVCSRGGIGCDLHPKGY